MNRNVKRAYVYQEKYRKGRIISRYIMIDNNYQLI